MRLTVYPSDKGDCLLVTGKDGKRILADGGMRESFSTSVAPELGKLRKSKVNRKLDIVYVSHIDEDHIAGVLQLVDDLVAWKIHDHKSKQASATPRRPGVPRPPEVGEIWHNGFRDVLGDNAGPIEDQLAANALVLSGFTGSGEMLRAVAEHQELAASIPQAIKLNKRIADGVLGIPHNRPAKGKLMMVKGGKSTIKVGGMTVRVLGPFEKDLEELRKDWNTWLRTSKAALATIRSQASKLEGDLTAAGTFVQPLLAEAATLATQLAVAMKRAGGDPLKKRIGDKGEVTAPNLASLTLHVSEGKKSLLLTGDAHSDEILQGLGHHGLLTNGGLHVNVLKVQHHGSEHNMTDEFAKAVTADHYVFCGDGFAGNPELVVLQRLFDARLGPAEKRSLNPEAKKSFTFWFNSNSKAAKGAGRQAHMRAVEKLMADLRSQGKKKMKVNFLAPGDAALGITP